MPTKRSSGAAEQPAADPPPQATETTVSTEAADRDQIVTFTAPYLSYNIGESAAFRPEEVQRLADLGVIDAGPPTEAPVNVDIPHVSQTGAVLNCTMGNWNGVPTSYAYAWQIDGLAAGTDAATYDVIAADVGKSAACVVTATNAIGSTEAPPSNSVVVA